MKTTSKFTCPAFATLALFYFTVLSIAHAVSPVPDGAYPGQNTAEGQQALLTLTTGQWNTAVGFQALGNETTGNSNTATGGRALFSNITGFQNTANGAFALLSNTRGGQNSAFGWKALTSNTTGQENTANGYQTLYSNTTGNGNTATGVSALYHNVVDYNTATGYQALFSNTTGFRNTANGVDALFRNTTGEGNTATGYQALYNNHGGNGSGYNGDYNTANGHQALFSNTSGYYNTGIGHYALHDNISGNNNTALGNDAMARGGGNYNTATGYAALVNSHGTGNTANGLQALASNRSGNNNTAVGYLAGGDGHTGVTTGSNNTLVGYSAGADVTTANDVICFGANVAGANVSNTTWIANIYGITPQSSTTATVVVSADGQLGTLASSERFKKDIATMEKASEAILSLRPVTFHYKTDSQGILQFGLIAEEVAKVNPALVLLDKEGKPSTVRYDAVNAMLLNEFIKEHQTVQELKKQVAELTAGLKKVSAQLELNKSLPQTVSNNR
jgi:hypothetical protein